MWKVKHEKLRNRTERKGNGNKKRGEKGRITEGNWK